MFYYSSRRCVNRGPAKACVFICEAQHTRVSTKRGPHDSGQGFVTAVSWPISDRKHPHVQWQSTELLLSRPS
jgi:hypothetical protein